MERETVQTQWNRKRVRSTARLPNVSRTNYTVASLLSLSFSVFFFLPLSQTQFQRGIVFIFMTLLRATSGTRYCSCSFRKIYPTLALQPRLQQQTLTIFFNSATELHLLRIPSVPPFLYSAHFANWIMKLFLFILLSGSESNT